VSERLIARLTGSTPPAAEWAVTDDRGTAGAVESGPIEALGQAARGRSVWVLVPGEDVLLTLATVPTRNRQRMLKALPYALEEQLAEEIEAAHLAVGPASSSGQLAVAVVARARLDGWLEVLRAGGVEPDRMLPETLALPRDEAGWRVLVEGRRALVRTGDAAGFAADRDNLLPLLRAALEETEAAAPARILVSGDDPSAADEIRAAAADLAGSVAADPEPASALTLLARGATRGPLLDLLQGPYDRRGSIANWLKPWRAAAAVALLWLLVEAGLLINDYQHLKADQVALAEGIEAVFRETLPEVQKIVNPQVQMERALRSLQPTAGGDGFLQLLVETGEVLRGLPGSRLIAVGYRGGRLDLDLEVPDLQALDRLKQDLSQRGGLDTGIQTVTAKEGRVQGRLQVKRSGA